MRRIPVSELKNRLSEFLRLVKRGETIEVFEHSVPIARIEGVRALQPDRRRKRSTTSFARGSRERRARGWSLASGASRRSDALPTPPAR